MFRPIKNTVEPMAPRHMLISGDVLLFPDLLHGQVGTKVAGIGKQDLVTIGHRIDGAAQPRRNAVDKVQPAGLFAAVKFIEIADALDVGGAVGRASTFS